jgi:hypothetical protein
MGTQEEDKQKTTRRTLPFKTIWVPPGLIMLLVVLVFCVVFVFVLFLVPTVACHLVILHCSEVYLVYVTERLASKLVKTRTTSNIIKPGGTHIVLKGNQLPFLIKHSTSCILIVKCGKSNRVTSL